MALAKIQVTCIAALAAGLLAAATIVAAAAPPQSGGRAEFAPIQSISYVFGSKSMSGYFVRESAACAVTLMIGEKSDPDHLLLTTPTRLRLVLKPGETTGLDSQEGRSLSITCGADARALLVDVSKRSTERKLL